MAQETLQPNPTELGGLTPDQQQKAIELFKNVGKAQDRYHQTNDRIEVANRYRSINSTRIEPGMFMSGSVPNLGIEDSIRKGMATHRVRKAKRVAKKHLKQNEGAYEEQALKEARDADVDVEGWPQD